MVALVLTVICMTALASAASTTPVNHGNPFTNGDFVKDSATGTWRLNLGVRAQVTDNKGYIETNPYSYPSFLYGLGSQYGWGNTKLIYKTEETSNARNIKYSSLPTWGDCAQVGNGGVTAEHYSCWRNAPIYLLEENKNCGWNSDHTVYHGVFVMLVNNDHAHKCVWDSGLNQYVGNFDQASLGGTFIYADWELNGSLKITKKSTSPSVTNNNSAYSFEGAKYYAFKSKADAQAMFNSDGTANSDAIAKRYKAADMVTNSSGTATVEDLPLGTYYLRERVAPPGFDRSDTIYTVSISAGKTTAIEVTDAPKGGYASVVKISANPSLSDSDGRYSKANAIYTIYRDSACSLSTGKTIKTNSSGSGKSEKLDAGTYYIKETTASPGYLLDTTIHKVVLGAGATTTFTSVEPLAPGFIDLQKISSNPKISESNGCYSLAGAEYGIFTSEACSGNPIAMLVTNEAGYAKSGSLAAGRYWVKEITPCPGFLIENGTSQTPYGLSVGGGITVRVNGSTVEDSPGYDKPAFVVAKIDDETEGGYSQGGAILAGAQFTVRYYDGFYASPEEAEASGEPLRTWVLETNASGKALLDDSSLVSGDPFYRSLDGKAVLPLGTLLIQETKAPQGYLLSDNSIHLTQVTDETAAVTESHYLEPVIADKVKRGDLALNKFKATNLERLASVPFKITCLDTGENHVMVTDGNGQAKTSSPWNSHGSNTNGNDQALNDDGTIDEEALDPEAGVWFGLGSDGEYTVPEDSRGALPYGQYRLDELRVSQNTGLALASIKFSVTKDGYELNFDVPNEIAKEPFIATKAREESTGGKDVFLSQASTIIDRVTYENLDEGAIYTLEATLMNGETGNPLLDESGNPVMARKSFAAHGDEGFTEISMTFNSMDCDTNTVVVFEKLLDKTGTLICCHEDLEDYSQTLRIKAPNVSTQASDGADGDSFLTAEPGVIATDLVTYKYLAPEETYRLTGSIQKLEGSNPTPLLDKENNPITSTIDFIPEESSGVITMEFPLDASNLDGQTLVIFEELSLDEISVVNHNDPRDKAQTLRVNPPTLETHATNEAKDSKTITAQPDTLIIDGVTLDHLSVGSTYTLHGCLNEKTDNGAQAILDAEGQPLCCETTLVAEEPQATTAMSFPLDTTALADKELVVYEKLYKDDRLVVDHSDPLNAAQTVAVEAPSLSSMAVDGHDGDKVIAASPEAKLSDFLSYQGLTTGDTYTACGTLYLRENEEDPQVLCDPEGRPITATVDFTAESSEGTLEVPFTFDSTYLDSKRIVVYEELYAQGVKIASHEDPTDENQTVTIASLALSSRLTGSGELPSAPTSEDTSLTDTVYYSQGAPDKSYTLYGLLIDTETGLPLLDRTADSTANPKELEDFWVAFGKAWGLFSDSDGQTIVGDSASAAKLAFNSAVSLPYVPNYDEIAKLTERYKDLSDGLVTSVKTFKAMADGGEVALPYSLDSRTKDNVSAVAICWATDQSGNLVAVHRNPTDSNQTITFKAEETPDKPREVSADGFPKTGDKLPLFLGILALALAIASVITLSRLRRNHRKEISSV